MNRVRAIQHKGPCSGGRSLQSAPHFRFHSVSECSRCSARSACTHRTLSWWSGLVVFAIESLDHWETPNFQTTQTTHQPNFQTTQTGNTHPTKPNHQLGVKCLKSVWRGLHCVALLKPWPARRTSALGEGVGIKGLTPAQEDETHLAQGFARQSFALATGIPTFVLATGHPNDKILFEVARRVMLQCKGGHTRTPEAIHKENKLKVEDWLRQPGLHLHQQMASESFE